MDNDLVDFAMTCPVDLKVKNLGPRPRLDENQLGNKKDAYFQQTNDGKSILREVMSNIIPSTITNAQKKGFSSPDASWFRGESIDFVSRRLMQQNSDLDNFIDIQTVQELCREHLDGSVNRRLLIWSLLSIQSLLNGIHD